jgi:excisionase family DNA binding protein
MNEKISRKSLKIAAMALSEDYPDLTPEKLAAVLGDLETPVPDELLTVQETADYLKVSRDTLYRLVKQHGIPVVKIGYHTRIRRRDINAMLTVGPVRTKEELNLFGGGKQAVPDGVKVGTAA